MTYININTERLIGKRDPMIYGQFIEHFHRQIYGGIFCPGSPLADENGFRLDVLDALRKISPPIIRWPGGCFVSSYHWRDGVGKRRTIFDKAWRVEEPNTFGTDEFVKFCKLLGSEPFICTNAGTGTPEEMSDWVEYCNLSLEGDNAKLRIQNGFNEPHKVKYWSIGNENYGIWEIGAYNARDWSLLVTESAKMMKRVDPSIQLSAAALSDVNWNIALLEKAGPYLDWISLHRYWNFPDIENNTATYKQVIEYTVDLDYSIRKAEGILTATGYDRKIKIAFDEWNLRGWYHPNANTITVPAEKKLYLTPRDKNDDNSQYTMAEAVFNACFFNTLLRHCNTVRMANYAPAVNTRGAIFVYPEGVVLRSAYHVFDLFMNHMGEDVIDVWAKQIPQMDVNVPQLDIAATKKANGNVAISLINKSPDETAEISIDIKNAEKFDWNLLTINGNGVDDYNDVDRPENIKIRSKKITPVSDVIYVTLESHSVNVLEQAERAIV